MGEFSVTHILLVLGIVLIFFGPSRLPSLGSSMGKAIRGFKDAMKGETESDANASQPSRDSREVKVVIQSAPRDSQERLQSSSTDYGQAQRDPSRTDTKI